MRIRWRPVILLSVVILLIVVSAAFGLGDRLIGLQAWIQSLGFWAPAIFILLFAAAAVAAVPGSAMTILAGAVFGSVRGVLIVSIASTLGAAVSFLISRYAARSAVERWLRDKETFLRLDRLTREHGAVIVALTRLVPLFPYNLLNYGFGLTGVGFRTYLFWTWLCMLPATVLYVVGADTIMQAITERRFPWLLIVLFIAVLCIAGAAARIARRKIREK
jgi:uncharacterized membrane protein YdjX (TVP38/TMEM64 family)